MSMPRLPISGYRREKEPGNLVLRYSVHIKTLPITTFHRLPVALLVEVTEFNAAFCLVTRPINAERATYEIINEKKKQFIPLLNSKDVVSTVYYKL